ncbi:hypothetical protein [Actinomycetospora cinnamomea]|uniref:Uncharacterized protein n=1 Tax=Actinomycetospora cinnamomea TaxID=663609 RepID=A0A2U1FLW3_9PSEU|nr:hypothetical protein [Actinomycetospora cinnamomea]PVZ13020.1 hypothetical protein C8D89_102168 [Actinomycetospora cinnamomea]
MRRGQWAKERERLWAASHEGVISIDDLVALGVPERTAYRRTQEDGPWTLLAPATFLLSNGEPTRRQLEIAALVYAGDGAVLTGWGGARHYGLRRGAVPESVHVLISWDRSVLSTPTITVERTRRLPRAIVRDGLAVAPLVRCLTDGARRTKDLTEIAAVFAEAVQKRQVLAEALRTELDCGSRKGTAAPRRVLIAVEAGVWSAAEYETREFWLSWDDLPEIEWNTTIYDEDGLFLAVADGLVREVGLVLQVDSVEHHFATPEQVQQTLEYHRRLRAAGLHVLGIRPAQRRDDPGGLHTDILDALDVARLLPPPRVRYEARTA